MSSVFWCLAEENKSAEEYFNLGPRDSHTPKKWQAWDHYEKQQRAKLHHKQFWNY